MPEPIDLEPAPTTATIAAPEPLPTPPRSEPRRFLGLLVIGTAVALATGVTLKMSVLLEANDISRWCTVWALLERGTYAIDECPWQARTQDKVKKPDKLPAPGPDAKLTTKLEYRLAPASWKQGEPTEHFYSSKPPLLPTLIAGLLYPVRQATGMPLDRLIEQKREPRYVQKAVEGGKPGETEFVLETDRKPAEWPVNVLYFNPVILLLNVVPMWVFLVLYARLLDRVVPHNDWAWFLSLMAAAFGTQLLVFDQTLNNHTVAAYSAFFALYPFLRIWDDGRNAGWRFLVAGFFGGFTACNEIPAALFGLLLFLLLLARFPKKTLIYFVPAAALPILAFLTTQFLAFGKFTPVYEEFGTQSYNYAGSYWNTPLEMDWFNKYPEPWGRYLFHMTLGHHGVFSLTPVFLFSILGAFYYLRPRGRMNAMAWLTLLLTVALIAFYTWNPKARNYGGSTQGLRWLFWLIPFWLTTLPAGVAPGQSRAWYRWLTLIALAFSVFSVGYALRSPWSHPWILDMLEHLNLYVLHR